MFKRCNMKTISGLYCLKMLFIWVSFSILARLNIILFFFFKDSLSLRQLYSLLSTTIIFLALNLDKFLTTNDPIDPAPPVIKIVLFKKILFKIF